MSMSIDENDSGQFITDPKQEMDREQRATEGEQILTEPLSRIQSEIQIQTSVRYEQELFKKFNLEAEENDMLYDSTTVQFINGIN